MNVEKVKRKVEVELYRWVCHRCNKETETNFVPGKMSMCPICKEKDIEEYKRIKKEKEDKVASLFVGATILELDINDVIDELYINVDVIKIKRLDGKEFVIRMESNWDDPNDLVIESWEKYKYDN